MLCLQTLQEFARRRSRIVSTHFEPPHPLRETVSFCLVKMNKNTANCKIFTAIPHANESTSSKVAGSSGQLETATKSSASFPTSAKHSGPSSLRKKRQMRKPFFPPSSSSFKLWELLLLELHFQDLCAREILRSSTLGTFREPTIPTTWTWQTSWLQHAP